jgi:ribosomal protein S18 acetylase RimI-like enzyme
MVKMPINEKLRLSVESEENLETAARLGAEISARFGPREEAKLAITARNADGALIGGLNGVTHWRWLYIRHLWVAADQRRAGLGRSLVEEAINLGRARGCLGAYVDTFDSAVAAYYEGSGFRRCGVIADFPPGAARIFLMRRLEPEASARCPST